MKRRVKVTLYKDSLGNYAVTAKPPLITLGERFESEDGAELDPMTLTWVLEEHEENPNPPNAKRLIIKFGENSPFAEDASNEYVASVGADGAQLETAAIRIGATAEDLTLYKYDVEVIAKGTDLDENGNPKDVVVKLDPHIRAKRGTVRKSDLMD